MTQILDPSKETDIQKALNYLNSSEPVALPTETVYGLAAPFDDPLAIKKIFQIKKRPLSNPLILHLSKESSLSNYTDEVMTELHNKISHTYWPGSLSLLVRKSSQITPLITAQSPYVVLRKPDHPVFQKILKKIQKPLVAPSANAYQSISPVTCSDVVKELKENGLKAVVDGGSCKQGLESTIIRIRSSSQIEVLRLGAVSPEDIEEKLSVEVLIKEEKTQVTPGSDKKHYAPQSPCVYVHDLSSLEHLDNLKKSLFFCVLKKDQEALKRIIPHAKTECLSLKNSFQEAAHKFYSMLRTIDQKDYSKIYLLACKDTGLGRTLNDRLKRAAANDYTVSQTSCRKD